jgi:hypothetical protein
MAAPIGNQNARKARECADALRWALENYKGSSIERGQALRAIATKLVERATRGDLQATQEIFNRLDGKAVQPIAGDGENPLAITIRDLVRERDG